MTHVVITAAAAGRHGYTIEFPYDAQVVSIIKQVPWQMRSWIPDKKMWWVESDWLARMVQERLEEKGHAVDRVTPGEKKTPKFG